MLPSAPITSTTSTSPTLTTAELDQMARDIAEYSNLVRLMDTDASDQDHAQTNTPKTD